MTVSAFVDEESGFGCPLSPAELKQVNDFRIAKNKNPLPTKPYPIGSGPSVEFFSMGRIVMDGGIVKP